MRRSMAPSQRSPTSFRSPMAVVRPSMPKKAAAPATPPKKAAAPAVTAGDQQVESATLYFSVVWGKASKRKHKVW